MADFVTLFSKFLDIFTKVTEKCECYCRRDQSDDAFGYQLFKISQKTINVISLLRSFQCFLLKSHSKTFLCKKNESQLVVMETKNCGVTALQSDSLHCR